MTEALHEAFPQPEPDPDESLPDGALAGSPLDLPNSMDAGPILAEILREKKVPRARRARDRDYGAWIIAGVLVGIAAVALAAVFFAQR